MAEERTLGLARAQDQTTEEPSKEELQRRLGEARIQLAHAEGDVGGLDGEIARLGEELERLMKRRERRTVLRSELEREEDR